MASLQSKTAEDVIAALKLTPHPEKGFYIETSRNESGTAIYYLLKGEEGLSHWHRVLDATETWHHYAGAPLRLSLSLDDGQAVRDVILGNDLWNGQRPQAVVQPGEWQHAQSLGEWSLVGCTVAPAFKFESFEMAQEGWEPRVG